MGVSSIGGAIAASWIGDLRSPPAVLCWSFQCLEEVRQTTYDHDARMSNERFGAAEPVKLASGLSLGSIEVDGHAPVVLGQVDVSDAFYNLALPVDMIDLFCLKPVLAGEVGIDSVGGRPTGAREKVYPACSAFPMGFKDAMAVC